MDAKLLATAFAFGKALGHDQYSLRNVFSENPHQKDAFEQSLQRIISLKRFCQDDFVLSFGEEVSKTETGTKITAAVIVYSKTGFLMPGSSEILIPKDIFWQLDEAEAEPGHLRTLRICLYREAITRALEPHPQYLP